MKMKNNKANMEYAKQIMSEKKKKTYNQIIKKKLEKIINKEEG